MVQLGLPLGKRKVYLAIIFPLDFYLCVCAQAGPLGRRPAASLMSPEQCRRVVTAVNDPGHSGFLYFSPQRSGEWFGGPESLYSD